MAEEQAQPQLALERIYVKDMSLEVPGADVFTKEWNPELDINLSSNAEKLDDDHYQVTLTVSVNAKNAEAPSRYFLIKRYSRRPNRTNPRRVLP